MDQNNGGNEGISLREVLFILKKHLRLILLATILCGVLGFVFAKCLIAPKYQADATLIVNPGQSTQNATITYDQVTAAKQLVGTYSIILTSDTVLDQVISDLSLNMDAKQLANSISVDGLDGTEVIKVSVKNKDPQTATKIVDDIIKVAPDIIIKTVKAGSVEIISPGKADSKPVSPKVLQDTVIAVLAGLVLSVVAAFIIEMTDNTFSSDEDIQKYLGLTVIGVIPNYEIKAQE
ncbi:MAG: Wzz/FepE/Etk N-terminal domain-containing protein [Clostridia bacterium]|nr:Wzz/FepE/Etk N-terminal domain-containing protein [Clostridia bacterium]